MGCWRSFRSAFSMELWGFRIRGIRNIIIWYYMYQCASKRQTQKFTQILKKPQLHECKFMQSELCRQSLPDSPLPYKKSPRAAVLCFNMFHACTLQRASNQNLPDWCRVNPWFVAEGWSKWVRFIQEMLNVIQAVWVVSRKNKYAGKLQRI